MSNLLVGVFQFSACIACQAGIMETWVPRTVEELESAITMRAVEETPYLDFKAFPQKTEGARKATARDLAAMSVDGGVLVLGVSETTGSESRTFELAPGPLSGWREWVSQIGLNGVQPPVRVVTRTLERSDGIGYLVVTVPASARAPHMVDGRYYGRADTTNYQLSDVQARELWRRNFDRRQSATELLRSEVDREPTPDDMRTTARLFVMCQPVSADPRLLLDAVEDRDLRRWVSGLSGHKIVSHPQTYDPGIHSTSQVSRRASGAARSTYFVGSDRTVSQEEGKAEVSAADLVDLEVHEDGGVRLYYGRASDWLNNRRVLLVQAIVGEVSCCVELVRHIADVAGFRGPWMLGVALRDLKSSTAYRKGLIGHGESNWPYSEDTYDEVYEADYEELRSPGSPVIEELLGRFCRSVLPHGQTATEHDLFPISEA